MTAIVVNPSKYCLNNCFVLHYPISTSGMNEPKFLRYAPYNVEIVIDHSLLIRSSIEAVANK